MRALLTSQGVETHRLRTAVLEEQIYTHTHTHTHPYTKKLCTKNYRQPRNAENKSLPQGRTLQLVIQYQMLSLEDIHMLVMLYGPSGLCLYIWKHTHTHRGIWKDN